MASHSHFTIASVDANGNAAITVTAPAGLTGSGQLDSTNGWVYTPYKDNFLILCFSRKSGILRSERLERYKGICVKMINPEWKEY